MYFHLLLRCIILLLRAILNVCGGGARSQQQHRNQYFVHLPGHRRITLFWPLRNVTSVRQGKNGSTVLRTTLSGKFSVPSVTWPCVVSIFIGVHRGVGPSSNIPHSPAASSNDDDNVHSDDDDDDYDDEDEDERSYDETSYRLPGRYHLLFVELFPITFFKQTRGHLAGRRLSGPYLEVAV